MSADIAIVQCPFFIEYVAGELVASQERAWDSVLLQECGEVQLLHVGLGFLEPVAPSASQHVGLGFHKRVVSSTGPNGG